MWTKVQGELRDSNSVNNRLTRDVNYENKQQLTTPVYNTTCE